mmetsp:Transcript_3033/g.4335  ORF Transcript_3033/g.4335 Transcript_3033/m.4335 type:complete len:203 (+) Transcript_3033:300-908(+)
MASKITLSAASASKDRNALTRADRKSCLRSKALNPSSTNHSTSLGSIQLSSLCSVACFSRSAIACSSFSSASSMAASINSSCLRTPSFALDTIDSFNRSITSLFHNGGKELAVVERARSRRSLKLASISSILALRSDSLAISSIGMVSSTELPGIFGHFWYCTSVASLSRRGNDFSNQSLSNVSHRIFCGSDSPSSISLIKL